MRNYGLLGICLLMAMPAFAAQPAAKPAAGPPQAGAGHNDHQAAPASAGWTNKPLLLPMPTQRGERSGAPFAVKNLNAPAVSATSGQATTPVGKFAVSEGKATVRTAANVGNYYWLQAQEESHDVVKVASTVRYFANPGPSPRAMLRNQKSELEIVPQPLPREHGKYREGERWAFLVRFKNQALPGATVSFETENGSKTIYATDNDGLIAVQFPRDMKPEALEKAGDHETPKAQYVLSVEHAGNGKHYQTAFNYYYEPHRDTGKSMSAGVAFMGLGAVLAAPLLRRRQKSEKGKKP